MGSVKVFIVFIVGGRSFMYIIKSKGPRIDPCAACPGLYQMGSDHYLCLVLRLRMHGAILPPPP
jgi:hypothetical protein